MSSNVDKKDMKKVVERKCGYGVDDCDDSLECWDEPCDTYKAKKKLVYEMRSNFIIPNWYTPKHFEQMKGWGEWKVERFKNYLSKCVSSHDGIKEYVEEVLENFIQDDKESSDEEDDDERYCDNEKCPHASYICFEELEKYKGKPWVCAKCVMATTKKTKNN